MYLIYKIQLSCDVISLILGGTNVVLLHDIQEQLQQIGGSSKYLLGI